MAQVHDDQEDQAVQPPVSNGVVSKGVDRPYQRTFLYVENLDQNVFDAHLYDLFMHVGMLDSVWVEVRRSLGYGYVKYNDNQDALRAFATLNDTPLLGKRIRIMYYHGVGSYSAKNAIEKLNGMLLKDKQVFVRPFLRKYERDSASDRNRFNNVYVKNLSESTTEEELKEVFGDFGTITSVVVMRDEDGKSKCFEFVNLEDSEDAARSVEALNGKKFEAKEWYVGNAQKKSERGTYLKGGIEQKYLQEKVDNVDVNKGLNLFVKNLDDSISTDDKLSELFSEFGTITSCKILCDYNGIIRRSRFVAFSTAEESSRALLEMNGKTVVSKALYVALTQHREDGSAKLQVVILVFNCYCCFFINV
ncbi:polyadenylate-binding protein 8-like [Carya illinoinensis]|uniref:polyadenylate-binding protein 8-like n=1 Tax=Carya illinoinensis TaxID=32201 RepID=UPI001C717E33|nr:polyadenylate-binding protein 8-like [Carya illinoinensis]